LGGGKKTEKGGEMKVVSQWNGSAKSQPSIFFHLYKCVEISTYHGQGICRRKKIKTPMRMVARDWEDGKKKKSK